jgi:hypothetical protein
MDTKGKNIQTILEIFRMIEERDPQKPPAQRELELVDSNVEMHGPASLPYGGTSRGLLPRPDQSNWGRDVDSGPSDARGAENGSPRGGDE